MNFMGTFCFIRDFGTLIDLKWIRKWNEIAVFIGFFNQNQRTYNITKVETIFKAIMPSNQSPAANETCCPTPTTVIVIIWTRRSVKLNFTDEKTIDLRHAPVDRAGSLKVCAGLNRVIEPPLIPLVVKQSPKLFGLCVCVSRDVLSLTRPVAWRSH